MVEPSFPRHKMVILWFYGYTGIPPFAGKAIFGHFCFEYPMLTAKWVSGWRNWEGDWADASLTGSDTRRTRSSRQRLGRFSDFSGFMGYALDESVHVQLCMCTYFAYFCIMFHHVNPHNSTHRRRNSVYMPYTSHNEAEPFLCFHSTWIHVTTGLTQDYPVQFAYLRLLGHWWREVQADGQSHERMPKINRLLNPLDSYIHILHPISFPV